MDLPNKLLSEESNTDDSQEKLKISNKEEYKTHFNSYIIITLYCLQCYFCGTFLTSLGAVINVFNKLYGISSSGISLTSTILSFSFGVVAIPFAFFSKTYGLRISILSSNIIFLIGSILRMFINGSNAVFFVGFIFLGVGSPLLINSQLMLINSWVHPNKRNLMNAIVSVVSPIGAGTAQILPLIFIDRSELNKNILKKQVFYFFLFYSIVMVIFLILNLIFLSDKPKKGFGNLNFKPSSDRNLSLKKRRAKFFKDIKFIITKLNFISSAIIYGLGLTIISILGTNINPIIEPFNNSSSLGIIVCVLAIFSGLIGAFLFSMFLQSRIPNRLSIQILFIIASFGMFLCPIGISNNLDYLLYIGSILLGAGVFSHCSVIMEYCQKQFENINSFIINSFLVVFQQIFQAIFILITGYFVSFQIKFYSILSVLLLIIFFFVIICLSINIK